MGTRHARFVSVGPLLVVLGACSTGCRFPGSDRGQDLLAPQPSPQDPMETIARYEDAHTDGDGLLQTLLRRGEPKTRERAAVALGRLDTADFGAAVTHGLVAALSDEVAAVRAAAAFALGQRGDASAASGILARAREADPLFRARLVEAASRIDSRELRAFVVGALDDADPRVVNEAVLGTARFPRDLPDAEVVDGLLLEFLARVPGASAKPAPDADARWRGSFALSRRLAGPTPRDRARERAYFASRADSADARERIFALQGLANVLPDDRSRAVLRSALADSDWRVACEAGRALKRVPDADALPFLARATEHASAHVRRAAFEALGGLASEKERVRPLLERARVDVSPNVRAAAIVAAVQLFGDDEAPSLELLALHKSPEVRAGVAAGAARLSTRLAFPLLDRLTRDPHLRVAGIAIEGLGRHPTPESRARLWELLRADDNGLRLGAVTALREFGVTADLPNLETCAATSTGDIANEIAANVLDNAAKIGGDAAREILRRGLDHADVYVRKHARELHVATFPDATLPRTPARRSRLAAVAIPGKDTPLWSEAPRVELRTNRGTMTFELFPDEAPAHVHNFLVLVQRHHYDGLSFHRVELDFVIQGGDVRGDGNGGTTWRGEPLRREFGPRKFVRGSLGMPRNDDADSGGSQIFVTHRETPHLDGRYTIFGELRSGFEVLDLIEVGDTILEARLVNPEAGR